MLNARFPRFRLLPLVILVAVLVMGVRMGGIWKGLEDAVAGVRLETPAAQAEQANTPKLTSTPPTLSVPAPSAPENSAPEQLAPEQLAQAAPDPAATPAAPAEMPAPTAAQAGAMQSIADPARDPVGFTQSEIEVLQKLAERREELDKREKELALRLAYVEAAERRIDAKVAELQALEGRIQELVKTHDDQEKARLDRLVKVYTSMKPKDAARIFDGLDMPILLDILDIMQERRAAPILAEMTAEKARLVTEELSRRQQLPTVDGPAGAGGGG